MFHGATYAPTPRQIEFRLQIAPRCWMCASDMPTSPMHLMKQIVPNRYITSDAIKFSKIGGRHGTLIFHSPPTVSLVANANLERIKYLSARLKASTCHRVDKYFYLGKKCIPNLRHFIINLFLGDQPGSKSTAVSIIEV
jgi:hypothetical protein